MADRFQGMTEGLGSPSTRYVNVTPNNSADLAEVSRAIRVGGAGDLTVIRADGISVLFSNCSAGEVLPIRVARVMATGTTATNLVAL